MKRLSRTMVRRTRGRSRVRVFVTPTVAGVSFVSKMADEDIVRSPPFPA